MNSNRVNEIMESMKAFSREKYQRAELLPEMFALQTEMVGLAFEGEHAALADLKIWDVEKHLRQLNCDLGNVADEEFLAFHQGAQTFCNLIKAEISGNRGEARAFKALQYMRSQNIILRNVGLVDGDYRTELDAVVITPRGITIVEVKNTLKNIFIDENGDYYRTGDYLRKDFNLAEKLRRKEWMLRKAIADCGINDVEVRSIVVFTDDRIEVQNECSSIKVCFLSQLSHLIDGMRSSTYLNDEEMSRMAEVIKKADSKDSYPFEFDVASFKRDFAVLMTVLEEASAKTEVPEPEPEVEKEEEVENEKPQSVQEKQSSVKGWAIACNAAMGAAVALASMIVVVALRKGGVTLKIQ